MPTNPIPLPTSDPIAVPKRPKVGQLRDVQGVIAFLTRKAPDDGLIGDAWLNYLTQLSQDVASSPTAINTASVADQSASISATDMSGGGLAGGLYEVEYYAAIVQAAAVSSSLTVVIGWTDRGVAKSYTGAAMTGNTTSTTQTGALLLRVDASSPVTYALTYASSGAPAMKFDFVALLRQAGL